MSTLIIGMNEDKINTGKEISLDNLGEILTKTILKNNY